MPQGVHAWPPRDQSPELQHQNRGRAQAPPHGPASRWPWYEQATDESSADASCQSRRPGHLLGEKPLVAPPRLASVMLDDSHGPANALPLPEQGRNDEFEAHRPKAEADSRSAAQCSR